MFRKINCHDLTLNSYANLDQHKIKLDQNQNPIWSLKYYKLLCLKSFTFRNQKIWRKATECENAQGFLLWWLTLPWNSHVSRAKGPGLKF